MRANPPHPLGPRRCVFAAIAAVALLQGCFRDDVAVESSTPAPVPQQPVANADAPAPPAGLASGETVQTTAIDVRTSTLGAAPESVGSARRPIADRN